MRELGLVCPTLELLELFFYFYAPKYQIKYYYGRSIQMKTFKYLTDVTRLMLNTSYSNAYVN